MRAEDGNSGRIDAERARSDLRFVDELARRARACIDPHAFHYVHWGWIVLVWFPLENWLASRGHTSAQIGLRLGALLLGFALSAGREIARARRPRAPLEDRELTRRIVWAVYGSVGAGIALSALAPSFGLIEGRNVPIVWGLVYTNIAFLTGLVYRGSFLPAAGLIFAGVIAAIVLQPWNGYILGPAMGLGMILPGLAAEREVRRQREEVPEASP